MYLRNYSTISDARRNNTTLPSRPIFEQAKSVPSALWFLLYYKKWKITKEPFLWDREESANKTNGGKNICVYFYDQGLPRWTWIYKHTSTRKGESGSNRYSKHGKKEFKHRQHTKKLVRLSIPKTLWRRRRHSLAWTCRQHLAQDIKGLVPSSPIYEFEGRGSVFSPLEVKHISGIRGLVFCPHFERWTKEVVSPAETGAASLSICKDSKRKHHHMEPPLPWSQF